MTVGEKAKAYDKVREKIAIRFSSKVADEIFSEFEESGDERIRKSLAAYFSKIKQSDMWDDEFSFGDILAWFEKQGKKDEEILILKDQIESLHAAIIALKEVHKIELEKQKQEWSEEDKNHVKSILSTIECCKVQFPNAQAVVEAYNADIDWIKSLKNRVQPHWKPSDMELDVLRLAAEKDGICLMKLYEQLKKLREK